MSETTILWIFGAFITVLTLVLAGLGGLGFSLAQRVTRLEAVLSLYSDKAAAILHSPHTPEMDALLEKFREEYIARQQELSLKDWERLAALTDEIWRDTSIPKGERNLAAWLNAICDHKTFKSPKEYKLD